jgi:hypothetical protein
LKKSPPLWGFNSLIQKEILAAFKFHPLLKIRPYPVPIRHMGRSPGVFMDEKRKDYRQSLKYPAKIDVGDGTPHLPCILTDVSASGARVIVEAPDKIPERFMLLLAAEHRTSRRCKVMWRDENQLGLAFLKGPVVKPGPRPGIGFRAAT